MANEVEVSTGEPSTELQKSTENSAAPLAAPILGRKDTKKSLKNPNSMLVAMAFKFKNSEGTPKDYAVVAADYCRAAKFGDADAQYALGWMYANGRGVPLDEQVAGQLFTMAAEQGHARAKETLTKISNVSSQPPLLACLLPDPPAPVVSATTSETTENEHKAVSVETTALFNSQGNILKLVNKLAPRYEIDVNLAMTFIAVESGFNTMATSSKNAQGLMQLIPETAGRFGVKDPYKAEDNIKGGLSYLKWLLAYFKGDVQLVAAAYNAGEGAVNKYKGIPPYIETQKYVQKITKLYNNTTHPYKDNLVKASPLLNLPKKTTI
ncbi:MAG: transglycosylase SLT domain-containing protein [Methylotenera sp.]|nr:transglycosylase SLT domain-containing protein [Methylotenera sp.]